MQKRFTRGPGIIWRLINAFTQLSSQAKQLFPELTEREHEALNPLARGTSNAGIAIELVIRQKTARNHVSIIFNKY